MTDRACFAPSELPPVGKRTYLADYYCGQVCSGGHDQFHGNAGSSRNLYVSAALDCFRGAGMTAYADLAREFAGWLRTREGRSYPASTRGKPVAVLGQPDARLLAENRRSSYHVAMALWILGLPDVEVVPDAVYQARLDALTARNPELAQRQDDRAVAGLASNLAHPVQVGATWACLTARPPRELLRLVRGGTASWFGKSVPSREVETDLGRRTVLVIDDAYVLVPSDIPNVNELRDIDDLLVLAEGRATAGMVEDARAHAQGQDVAQAAMLLLRRAIIHGPVARITHVGRTPGSEARGSLGNPAASYAVAMQSGEIFSLVSGPRGARLDSGSDGSISVEATSAEIRAAARARRTRRELRDA